MKKEKGRHEIEKLRRPASESSTLSRRAKDSIVKLVSLTKDGSRDAATELHSAVAFAVDMLTWLCRKPELFTRIAQEKLSWPVMYSPHPEKMRETATFVRKMKLGRHTEINLAEGKVFSWQVPANVIAFNLHRLAQSLRRAPMRSWTARDFHPLAVCGVGWSSPNVHRYDEKYEKQLRKLEAWGQHGPGKQLPPLSKQTAAQWAEAAKELFLIAYGEKFDEHPRLQALRKSVSQRAKDASGNVGGRGLVRKAMKQAVGQAWHSISALD